MFFNYKKSIEFKFFVQTGYIVVVYNIVWFERKNIEAKCDVKLDC